MTPEQTIERARLVRLFLDSEEFKAAWSAVDDELVREFRDADSPEDAIAVHDEMRAMKRLLQRWNTHLVNAAIAKKEKEERERPRMRGIFR